MADRTPSSEQRDPLQGDWSEGLPGPVRPLGIPAPQPLFVEVEAAQPARPLEELAGQAPAEVETPDAWGAAAEDPLQSAPPPAQAAPDPFAFAPPAPFAPGTPLAPAAAFAPAGQAEEDEIVELGEDDEAEAVAPAADAAWDVPAAAPAADAAWDVPAAAPAMDAWDAAAPAQPETAAWSETPAPAQPHEAALLSEIETAEPIVEEPAAAPKPQDEALPAKFAAPPAELAAPPPEPAAAEPPSADWSTFSNGPDWSAPPAAAPAAEAAWGAPAEPAQTWSTETAWTAPAAAEPTAPAAETDWTAPPPPAPEPAGWTSANNTLLQMEGEPEPIPTEPGAAQELFGSVPVGGSLSADDEDELPAAEEVEDPDLPVPVAEEADVPVAIEASEPPPADDTFAGFAAPANESSVRSAGPEGHGLRVPGEHRVAVHTRGGSTKRGVVRDVDLSQRAFALEPAAGGEGEPVQHDDVKAIFFMLPPGESPQPGGHGRVKVTFADGRSIEGERAGAEDKNGFFLVPQDAARTNTWRIYVAREATTEIRDL